MISLGGLFSVRGYLGQLLSDGALTEMLQVNHDWYIDPMEVVDWSEKYVIARSEYHISSTWSRTQYVYYPKNLDHAELFSVSGVLRGGPQSFFPGSAAVLDVDNKTEDYWTTSDVKLNYAQFCFRQGSPSSISRSLASKYMGARFRLFQHFFSTPLALSAAYINTELRNSENAKGDLERAIRENQQIQETFVCHKDALLRKEDHDTKN